MTVLNGFSIFGGIVFIVVIALVIYPISFRLPAGVSSALRSIGAKLRLIDRPSPASPSPSSIELETLPHKASSQVSRSNQKRIRINIGLSSAPLLGVLLLLITTCIGGAEIRKGIAGSDGVRPYDVLVLFISLAYIATALDATGGLRFISFHVALRATSGNQLYFLLFTFFFFCGAIMGNDPIILSGTPFLAYLTRVSGIVPPTAWIFGQFLAANVSSAILVSSNPTNVLIAGAFNLNFLSGFTKYTILPSVVAAIVAYPLMFFAFKTKRITRAMDKTAENPFIPSVFEKPDVDPKSALVDPQGAVFHTILLLVTLAVLVGTSFVGHVEVWMVTAPAGLLGLARDIAYDLKNTKHKVNTGSAQTADGEGRGSPSKEIDGARDSQRTTLPSLWRKFSKRLPNAAVTISRLPWPLLPFAVGWTAKACTSPAAAVFFVGGIVALGLCPLCGTNIGATILAVEVLKHPNFQNAAHVQADPRILRGAIYAVALASNTGALATLPSSLAGLLWSRILSQKGIRITQTAFSLINFVPVCAITFVSLGIILVEVMYWD